MNSKKLFANYKQYITFSVLLSAILLITYKFFIKTKKPSWIKILLFINSLIINDISLRYVAITRHPK